MQPQVILITGASSGFGKITAQMLSERGHIVYGTSRKPSEDMNQVKMLVVDVTNFLSVCQAVERILSEQGRIDVLINNAGIGIGGALELATEEEVNIQMNTNFFGVVNMCKAVLPSMRKARKGKIINISSIGGVMGIPYQGFYSASKFAVEGYSEALALEVHPFHIKVCVVEPGDFNTGFTDNRNISEQTRLDADYGESFLKSLEIIEKEERNGCHPQKLGSANNVNDQGFSGGGGPPRWRRNNGLTATKMLGVNFATQTDKLELGGSARYNYQDGDIASIGSTEDFLPDGNSYSNSNSRQRNKAKNFNADFRMEWKPDSMTNIIFRPNFSYGKTDNLSNSESGTFNSDPYSLVSDPNNWLNLEKILNPDDDPLRSIRINAINSGSLSDNKSVSTDATLQLNRKLNDKGRNVTFRGRFGYTNNDNNQYTESETHYFQFPYALLGNIERLHTLSYFGYRLLHVGKIVFEVYLFGFQPVKLHVELAHAFGKLVVAPFQLLRLFLFVNGDFHTGLFGDKGIRLRLLGHKLLRYRSKFAVLPIYFAF